MRFFYVNTHYLTLLVLFAKKKAHFPPENYLRLIKDPKNFRAVK